jgi:hypothetical protein
MGRDPEIHLSFPARYDVTLFDRLRPRPPDYTLALGFPGGGELDPQQELAQPPIFAVCPEGHTAWVGTFWGGGYGAPPAAATQIVGVGYDGDLLRLSGFDAPANAFPEFTIDLRDSLVVGQPHR